MAELQTLRRRIRSVANTRQTTKAMQLVDATKLRRAQEASRRSKAYIEATLATLQRLLGQEVESSDLKLWRRDKVRAVALMVIASDRGLAGAYNHNITARLRKEVAGYSAKGVAVKIVAIGSHAIRAAQHQQGATLLEQISGRPTDPGIADVQPLAELLRREYAEGKVDAIEVIYTHSISALKQEVRVAPIWPIEVGSGDKSDSKPNHVLTLLEPSPEEVIDAALARLFDASVLSAAQEAGVSEHAMRMLAMRNATDNASDLIDTLTLQINTVRQAGITQEIAEITGAVAAIEEQ